MTVFAKQCVALAELIQVDNFFEGFSAPCNLPSVVMPNAMRITTFLAVGN
jgi:hypothetical protein